MQRQKTAIVAGRRRQAVAIGRFAAWLDFAGAVSSQAAFLAGGYFLAENATANAAMAGVFVILGLVVMIAARRAGKRWQGSAINVGRVPLRLVAGKEIDREFQRPAA